MRVDVMTKPNSGTSVKAWRVRWLGLPARGKVGEVG